MPLKSQVIQPETQEASPALREQKKAHTHPRPRQNPLSTSPLRTMPSPPPHHRALVLTSLLAILATAASVSQSLRRAEFFLDGIAQTVVYPAEATDAELMAVVRAHPAVSTEDMANAVFSHARSLRDDAVLATHGDEFDVQLLPQVRDATPSFPRAAAVAHQRGDFPFSPAALALAPVLRSSAQTSACPRLHASVSAVAPSSPRRSSRSSGDAPSSSSARVACSALSGSAVKHDSCRSIFFWRDKKVFSQRSSSLLRK